MTNVTLHFPRSEYDRRIALTGGGLQLPETILITPHGADAFCKAPRKLGIKT